MGELNVAELAQDFAGEKKCRTYLERLRWPHCVQMPALRLVEGLRIVQRDQFLFRDTMLELIDSPKIEYKLLTANLEHVA
jgi:hypothetical protein